MGLKIVRLRWRTIADVHSMSNGDRRWAAAALVTWLGNVPDVAALPSLHRAGRGAGRARLGKYSDVGLKLCRLAEHSRPGALLPPLCWRMVGPYLQAGRQLKIGPTSVPQRCRGSLFTRLLLSFPNR